MSNNYNTTLYIGVTSNIIKRVWEHKNHVVEGFTDRYRLTKLIYYEFFDDMKQAISREKQLKRWSRLKKDLLITKMNPDLKDLFNTLV